MDPQHGHQMGRRRSTRSRRRAQRQDFHRRLFAFLCFVLFREFISLLQSLFALCMLILLLKSLVAAHRVHQLQPLFRHLRAHILKFFLEEAKEAVGLPRSNCTTAYCQKELPAALHNLSILTGSHNQTLNTRNITMNFAGFLDTKHDFRQVQGHLNDSANLNGYELYEQWCRMQNLLRTLKLFMFFFLAFLRYFSISLLRARRH